MQKQQQLLFDQIEQEESKSSYSGGECCEENIDKRIGNCERTNKFTSVGDFILISDDFYGWTFIQMFYDTKSVFNEIKTELVEYDCGTWKGTGDSRQGKFVIIDMKLLIEFLH